MGPGPLRGYAADLEALARALDAAVSVHGAAGDALAAGADALAGAWSSPLGDRVVAAAYAGRVGLSAPPSALAEAATACRDLAAASRATADELARLDAELGSVDRAITSAGASSDAIGLEQHRQDRARLRQARDAAVTRWTQAAGRAATLLGSAAEAVRDGAATVSEAAGAVPRVPLALPGDGAAVPTGGGLPTGDGLSRGDLAGSLLSWSQRLATLGTLHDLVWVHPRLPGVTPSFRREVLALPEAARLSAFLRWQEEVGQRVPLTLAIDRLARDGALPPSYRAAAPDVPTAPNLSATGRATSGLRVAGRWLAPVGLFTGGLQLRDADGVGDHVAAGAGLFSAGVGTLALAGVAFAPPVLIAAGVAGVGALLYEGWKHRDAIGAWISDAWSWTTGKLSTGWHWATGALATAWTWSVDAVTTAWNWTSDAVSGAWNWGTTAVSDAWKWTTDAAASAWDWTADTASSAWDATTGAVSSAWDWGTGAASSAWDWSKDTASSAWDGVTGVASSVWNWGGDAIDWAAVKAADAWDWTTGAATAVAGWAADRVDDVRTWVGDTAGAVIDWSADHLPTPVTGGRTLWWLEQASESLFGTPSPPPTPFEQPELLAPLFDPLGVAPPADPAAVAAIFADLDPAVARDLVLADPAVLGNLDGVPPGLRHEANLAALAAERGRLDGRLAEIDARLAELGPLPPGALAEREQALRLRAERLEVVEARRQLVQLSRELDRGSSRHPRQLLLFDADAGRFAVSTGDVGTATHVTTLAMGTGSDLASISTGLADLERWTATAEVTNPGSQHAHVLWLGYDAPPNLLQASSPSFAHRGAPAFADFAAGMRAVNPEAHQVAGGHSYGSSLAGEAAATYGLDVDGLLLLATPGGRASHVDDYRLADGATVAVATDTAWRPTGPDDDGGWDIIHVASGGSPTSALGPDPTSHRFGAEVLDVGDAGGHGRSDYLAEETRSLRSLAAFSNGQLPEEEAP